MAAETSFHLRPRRKTKLGSTGMPTFFVQKTLLTAVAVGLFASATHAATSVYTDRAAFDLATGGTLAFDDFSSGSTTNANFSVTGNGVFVTNDGELRGRPTIRGSDMTYTFSSPISAFGGDFDTSPGGNGIGLRFTLGSGEVVSEELSAPYDNFWGFVADTTFTTLTISGGSGFGFAETHTFDNFSFGIAAPLAPVPLPASLPLLFAAVAGLFGVQRWSRRRAVSP